MPSSDFQKGAAEESRRRRTGILSLIGAAPVLVATDRPALGELYARTLEETGLRVRQGSLGPQTMQLAWKRSFSLAIIECQGRLNLAIEIAVAVRFRSRRAPLILFGTGSPLPPTPHESQRIAPIRFVPLPPEAGALVAEVRGLLEMGRDAQGEVRRHRGKGKGRPEDPGR